MRPMAWLILLGLFVAPCVIVLASLRVAKEGGWKRIGRLFLVMAATAFVTWMLCDFRLRNWKSKQGMYNRMNVCVLHDNLTGLLDIGDEKLAREYVGFFASNGCTFLNYDLMQTEQGKALYERRRDWYARILELQEKAKEK